jgi:lipid A ethanolaminephosphotransferase
MVQEEVPAARDGRPATDGKADPKRPTSWRPTLSTEALAVGVSVFFALACNERFLSGATATRSWSDGATWGFAACMLLLLTALHTLMLCLVLHRRYARVLLTALILVAALSTYYMQRFGVFLDPSMLRNVLHTDPAEAGELIGVWMLPHLLLYAVLPIALLWWVRVRQRSLSKAVMTRLATLAVAAGLMVVSLLLVFQDFAGLMRNQRELRYLITPANAVYSTARVLAGDAPQVGRERRVVGADAMLGPGWQGRSKPALFVVVVGETARAANWGLNGYARQTTPELAKLDVLNFSDVTACGTNTETSLPCMFSAVGRRDYNEERIRGSESLLHVLARAGFGVQWRDNQSGCKGVCAGLPQEQLDPKSLPDLCSDGHCLDDVLLHGLDTLVGDAQGNMVLVLHMLGNHGPAYHKRYPAELRRFVPTCDTSELGKCSRQDILNAYDNALLSTDRVLANLIAFLKERSSKYNTAMMYVSDHGESLGESGLYLHGVPYAIAPSEQKKVPMVWWLSSEFMASFDLNRDCLAAQTAKPLAHDHLFHSVLGLLQVQSAVYEPAFDVSAACRH